MKKFIALLLAALLVFSLAACQTTPAATDPVVDQTTESTTPTIDAIKAAGKLVVMTNAGFPPFEYIGENGEVVGVDMDLAKLVADELGVELEIVDMNFDLLIGALKSGKGNLVSAGMTATAERAEEIDFTVIYIKMGLKVIIPVGSDITSFDDLADKKIAVQEATTADIYVQQNYTEATPMQFKNPVDAVNAVLSGNADAAIVDLLPAEAMSAANASELILMEGLLSEEETAMAVAKGQEDFLALVNQVLTKALADGTLDELFASHMAKFDVNDF